MKLCRDSKLKQAGFNRFRDKVAAAQTQGLWDEEEPKAPNEQVVMASLYLRGTRLFTFYISNHLYTIHKWDIDK